MAAVSDTEVADGQNGVPQKELGSDLWEKMKNGDYEGALSEIKEKRHHEYLVGNSLELVPVITILLAEDLDLDGEKCVQDLLVYIASVANPKEAILVFLEELEMNTSSLHFRTMLQPIHATLMRQVSQATRAVTFSWVFNTLYSCLAAMKIPTNLGLEGKERKLLDVHPEIEDVSRNFECLVDFYKKFYHKVRSGDLVWSGKTPSREYLAMFLLQLYHKPLAYLDVYCPDGEAENSLYRTSANLTTMVADLLLNPFKLFSYIVWDNSQRVLVSEGDTVCEHEETADDEDEDDDKDVYEKEEMEKEKDTSGSSEVSQLSLSCFFYCALGQNMAIDCLPQVYSSHYVYISCVPLIVNLLKEKEDPLIHKGLILGTCLLGKIEEKTLPSACLEAKAHSSLPQLLIKTMIYCSNKELRILALEQFKHHFSKFDSIGKRKLIHALLVTVKHAGALGLVIHELKENVAFSQKQKPIDPNFSGKHLIKLTKLLCSLPNAEKTDLLEWSDCIVPALNFLIFTFLRDQDSANGIKDVVPYLQNEYFAQIQKGLDLSRCHYELKLKELEHSREKDTDVSVYIAGIVLPSMPVEQEKSVIQTAICSLDMIQCVLVRAKEVVDRAS